MARSPVVWFIAIALTWGLIGYDLYDRHQNYLVNEQGRLQQAVMAWGNIGQPEGFTRIIANGALLQEFSKTHRLMGVCFHDTGVMDHLDIPLSKSGLYDVFNGSIALIIKFNDNFSAEYKQGQTGTVYSLLAVPNGVSADQFNTLRQAQALGVKMLGAAGGPP